MMSFYSLKSFLFMYFRTFFEDLFLNDVYLCVCVWVCLCVEREGLYMSAGTHGGPQQV